MNIKNWYTENYTTDIYRLNLNPDATFDGLYKHLSKNVYDYIGYQDSLIRERLFARLAEIKNVPYDVIYKKWLGK